MFRMNDYPHGKTDNLSGFLRVINFTRYFIEFPYILSNLLFPIRFRLTGISALHDLPVAIYNRTLTSFSYL